MIKRTCVWPFGCETKETPNRGREFDVAGQKAWACDKHAWLVNVGGTLVVEGLRAGAVAAAKRVGVEPVKDVISRAATVIKASVRGFEAEQAEDEVVEGEVVSEEPHADPH